VKRHFGYELAFVALAGTLAIFLFPVVSGPFSTVYGPATALRAMRSWLQLLAAISLLFSVTTAFIQERSLLSDFLAFHKFELLRQCSVLRC